MNDLETTGDEQMTDAYGNFKNRFDPALVAKDAFSDDNDVLLFLHIPKTAGMSVGASLQGVFDVFHGVSWKNTHTSFVNATCNACYERTRNSARQVLMGHFNWKELQYWRNHRLPIKAATFIREPLARFVSHYRYNTSDQHPAREQFKEKYPTMLDFARDLERDYQLNFLLGTFFSFEDALNKLTEDFSFIGVTEHLGASFQHFARSHGFPDLEEFHLNKATGNGSQEEIDDDVREIVLDKSFNDLRLFELVRSYYE